MLKFCRQGGRPCRAGRPRPAAGCTTAWATAASTANGGNSSLGESRGVASSASSPQLPRPYARESRPQRVSPFVHLKRQPATRSIHAFGTFKKLGIPGITSAPPTSLRLLSLNVNGVYSIRRPLLHCLCDVFIDAFQEAHHTEGAAWAREHAGLNTLTILECP